MIISGGVKFRYGVFDSAGECFGLGQSSQEAEKNAASAAEDCGSCHPGDGARWIRKLLEGEWVSGLRIIDAGNDVEDILIFDPPGPHRA